MQQQYVMKKTNWNRDETILALDLYFKCNGPNIAAVDETHPGVIELSEFLKQLPIHDVKDRKDNFRSPGGVSMKLQNLLRWDPSHTTTGRSGLPNGSKLEGEIWDTFASNKEYLETVANAIRDNYWNQSDIPPDYHDEDAQEDDGATEGKLLTRVHKQRERNSKLAKRKKSQALKAFGKLECEVCKFDFTVKYGTDLGDGVIDCHHKTPLSELKPGTKTKLSDLALVCPNCHRILHKGAKTMSVETLSVAIG